MMELMFSVLVLSSFYKLSNGQLCQQLCIAAGAALVCTRQLTTLSVEGPWPSPLYIIYSCRAINSVGPGIDRSLWLWNSVRSLP